MLHRNVVNFLILAICTLTQLANMTNTQAQDKKSIGFFIGGYTGAANKGIHYSRLDLDKGTLSPPELVAELQNPTFLAIHPTLDVLYSVSEVRRDGKRENAQVLAYKIGPNGKLDLISGLPAGGDGPCYIATDRAGKFAMVANYSSGSISVFPIDSNGQLQPATANVQHVGKSANPQRQEGPHAHCIMTDPSDKFVCAVDLGMDQVVIYALDRSNGSLKPTGEPFKATPGFGPRHLAFHPSGKYAFVIHEIGSQLSSCKWDQNLGQLTEIEHVSTLPADFKGDSSTAEVLVHPNGRFVYGSNRGHDSIVCFALDESNGKLTLVSHTSTKGKTPRNFRIDPSGKYLLAQNQGSDSTFAFKIDPQSGQLTQVGEPISTGGPCCIKFLDR